MAVKKNGGLPRRRGTAADRQLRARGAKGALPDKLPLVHVTAVGIAREIVAARQLQTSPCPVFGKVPLLYFFVLRPAYRRKDGDAKSHQINRFPFVFILSPDAIPTPYHVYPFDTGGAESGVFAPQADPHDYLEDYELAPSHEAAVGHIGWAFETLDAYFEGELRRDILAGVPQHETVTRGFVDIARLARTGSNQPDKRASAVEIATNQNVPLKGNVLLAILPKQYLEDASVSNKQFMDRLKAEEVAWKTYDWQPNTAPNEFQEEIARIAKKWLSDNKLL